MDRDFLIECIRDLVYDLFPTVEMELTPNIEEAIDSLADEVQTAVDNYTPPTLDMED